VLNKLVLREENMNLSSTKGPLVLVTIGGLLIVASFFWGRLVPVDRMIDKSRLEGLTVSSEKLHKIEASGAESSTDSESAGSDGFEGGKEDSEQGALHGRSGERARILDPDDIRKQKESEAYMRRVLFLSETAPQLTRWLGVILAAAGSILYPVVLLRKASEEAEEENARVTE
jgi:hypothetical protein